MATFLDMEKVRFTPGMRVRATRLIVEGQGSPDADAGRCCDGWVHARRGDVGVVVSLTGCGAPSVAFDRTRTETVVAEEEVDVIPPEPVDPDVPFLQANTPDLLRRALKCVIEGTTDAKRIARRVAVDPREADYYGNAGVLFGLLKRVPGGFVATENAALFLAGNVETRRAIVYGAIQDRPVFAEALQHFEWTHRVPDIGRIRAWVRKHEPGLARDTRERRADSVYAWLKWLTEMSLRSGTSPGRPDDRSHVAPRLPGQGPNVLRMQPPRLRAAPMIAEAAARASAAPVRTELGEVAARG
jgi:hypothetical protein